MPSPTGLRIGSETPEPCTPKVSRDFNESERVVSEFYIAGELLEALRS